MTLTETKACTKCKAIKSISEFCKDARRRDGLQSWCKACFRISVAKWQKANPEKAKARCAVWYAKNADKAKAAHAAWCVANPDKMKEYRAIYRAKNPDKVRVAIATWRSKNREAFRIYSHNRRSLQREIGGKLSPGLAERLYKLQRGKCACCGQPLGNKYHLDHIMPIARGGANVDSNIQLLRQRCNNQKSAKHPVDFMQQKGFLL